MTGNVQKIESANLRTLNFHGDEIVTFEDDGKPHIAMRRVVENLGMNWGTQRDKLISLGKFNCTLKGTVGNDGKLREMLCMPVERLPLWLATINPNRIQDTAKREKIELYQLESAIALNNYWTKGVAVRGDMEGVVSEFSPQALKQHGGVTKAVVRSVVKELVGEVLPDMVQSQLTSGHLSVVSGVTASQVVDMAGIKNRKGTRGLVQWVSNRLRIFHLMKAVRFSYATLADQRRLVFDRVAAMEWLNEGGKQQIENWIRERRGQQVFKLVAKEPEA